MSSGLANVETVKPDRAVSSATVVQLAFRRYERPFVQALQTAHGPWRSREGLILRLTTPLGQVGYGEIAPIPWFGTETLREAIAFLTALQATESGPTFEPGLTLSHVSAAMERAPARYSATRFGLGLAIALLQDCFPPSPPEPQPQQVCALLPTGPAAFSSWPELWQQGHRTFKWKIGVAALEQEFLDLVALRRLLPSQAKLRLDANGGLSLTEARALLRCCDDLASQGQPIEFVEQPLPPAQFDALLELSQSFRTPLALDESVTGLAQLRDCHARGWQGLFVVKGAIAGDPQAIIRYCRSHSLKLVFSSVFETSLARQAVFAMAQAIQGPSARTFKARLRQEPQQLGAARNDWSGDYALGFGVSHWLKPDGLGQLESSDGTAAELIEQSDHDTARDRPASQNSIIEINVRGDALWQRLSNG